MKTAFAKLIFVIALSLITGCKNEPTTKHVDRENTIILEDLKEEQTPTFEKGATPKNVILVIGDGTGINQISALQYFKDGKIHYEDFPVIGLSKISSTSLITDSAAAGTAMACGEKTFNKAIGVNTKGQDLANLIEFMSQKGGSSGLIATSSITHATPASFYAHHTNRNDHEIIASFLPNAPIDFFAGAGLKYFRDRKDQVNLLDTFAQKGFTIETSSLKAYPEAKKLGYLLADKDMPTMIEGRGTFLEDASNLAINHLSSNEQGFLLMVEGSQVDWGGHDNDFDYMISELIDLDNTLGRLMAYAQKDQNTLIVVTGDHATGGLALSADQGDYNTIKPTFSSTGHNADWIPVFAYGPGAELFSGVYENTMIFHKIKALLSRQK
ncbi:MAG: alkaline phosphatase [Bacteroidetes bacterium]|nr:alkaline phosphatase [Bacteroidota bacterium]